MKQNIDHNTLSWVKEEIDETLKHARQALEEYVENDSDAAQLRFTHNYIHQVHGTLRMVQLEGASRLTEEMELLAQALLNDKVKNREAAFEALMRGVIQLPDYLEKVQSGLKDDPLILLPLLNDLRAARGEEQLSEGALFSPRLDTNVSVPQTTNESGLSGQELAKKLRHNFQVSLLGWYRNQDPKENLAKLASYIKELQDACVEDAVVRVWWVCGGFLEALLDGGLTPSVAMNKMLGQVDREVKRLIDEGEQALIDKPSADLLANLLYYVARATSTGPKVTEIKQKFDLDRVVEDEQQLEIARRSLGGPNTELLETVSAQIREHLALVKDALDLFIRGKGKNTDDLVAQSEVLHKIADTLGMLNLGVQRKLILDQDAILQEIVAGSREPEEQLLMSIAHELLNVEAALDRLAKNRATGGDDAASDSAVKLHSEDVRQIQHTLLNEIGVNITRIKDAIVTFIEAPWDYEALEEVPKLFAEVQGGMKIIGFDEPARYLGVIRSYVESELIADRKRPETTQLDAIADTIASVEYYLEAVSEQRPEAESILAVAAEALDKLGFEPPEEPDAAQQQAVAEQAAVETGPELETTDAAVPAEPQDSDAAQDVEEMEIEIESIDNVSFATEDEQEAADAADEVQEEDDGVEEIVIGDLGAPAREEPPAVTESKNKPQEASAASKQLLEEVDDDILSIFVEEAREELEVITSLLPKWKQDNNDFDSLGRIRRSFHTLKGSGRLVGATVIGEFAWAFENMINRVLDKTIPVTDSMIALVGEAADTLPVLIDAVESGETPGIDVEILKQRAFDEVESGKQGAQTPQPAAKPVVPEAAVPARPAAETAPVDAGDRNEQPVEVMDATLYEIFSKESKGHLAEIRAYIEDCEQSSGPNKVSERLIRSLHTLHGSARMAGASEIAELAGILEKYTKTAMGNENALVADGMQALVTAVKYIEVMLDQVNKPVPQATPDSGPLIEKIKTLYETELAIEEQRLGLEESSDEDADQAVLQESADYDAELLEVFLEEGSEILDTSELILQKLKAAPTDLDVIGELQRELHTLKGGARMAGIEAIGDLSHAVESLLTDIAEGRLQGSKTIVDVLHQVIDRLYNMLELAQQRSVIHPSVELLELIESLRSGEAPAALDDESTDEQPVTDEVPPAEPVEDDSEPAEEVAELVDFPSAPPLRKAVQKPAAATPVVEETKTGVAAGGGQDVVRVRADLLDNLVNFAGEVSIYRSRLEQQNSVFNANLGEMGSTVSRLQEQLRKLEMETEAQILYRYEQEGVSRSDFDPLELDRYSQVQELSRSLSESINDISSIKGLLDNLIRESDTLLLQQSRVNTELQEGLMRTRMIPFSQIVTRLRRLVRQTCKELHKEAELEIIGEQGEIDRTVLERITAPIEHMLRNAIAHGIEDPKRRKALKKPVKGRLLIEISRQGSEVMLKISDDGAGVDIKAIRDKAIQKGLMNPNSDVTENDILQFILESGFSTARKVTQISGRGVGMDVVASEVKQLGGSLDIASERGKGVTFTIMLPLTMAVNHAILAEVGDESYAIPLNGIEGIVRLSHSELEKYHADPKLRLEYGENKYQVKKLGNLLGCEPSHQQAKVLPVLLVRSGDHRAALQVDNLLGSREIIVKSVGPQISTVRGVSGATILGDGRVVLILDTNVLIRMSAALTAAASAQRREADSRVAASTKPTIMVVDDSITVRKVTTRLLERNDMEAISAKDGVDAVAMLEERIPDLILLDIEMPRMDGFEFASYIRNDSKLKRIPIIMITSRTGEKHRKRAMSIGVDDYLGKPYQEIDLLQRIQGLLKNQNEDG